MRQSLQNVELLQRADRARAGEGLALDGLKALARIAHKRGKLDLDTLRDLRACCLEEALVLREEVATAGVGVVRD